MYKAQFPTVLVAIVFILFSSLSQAGIYKYKDKYGRWQFTDKPLNDEKSQVTADKATSTKGSTNLKESLNKKYKPRSKVDEATLAVVKVVTKAGTGSGFFVTDDGYLVTNKHVVRPASTDKWERNKVKLDEQKVKIDELEMSLKDDKENLGLQDN